MVQRMSKAKLMLENTAAKHLKTTNLSENRDGKRIRKMVMSFKWGVTLVVLAFFPLSGHSGLLDKNPLNQNIFINNNNLTLKEFMLVRGSNVPEERRYADLYLLGVVDATEGKVWCSYRTLLTTSILDWVDMGLKELNGSRHNERAAYVITDILSKSFPCKEK
jgi:hypothetical protein